MTVTDNGTNPTYRIPDLPVSSADVDSNGVHAHLDVVYRASAANVEGYNQFLCFRNTRDTHWVRLTSEPSYWKLDEASDVPDWIVSKYGDDYRGCYLTAVTNFTIQSVVTTKIDWEAERAARTEPEAEGTVDIAVVLRDAQAEIERLTEDKRTLTAETVRLTQQIGSQTNEIATLRTRVQSLTGEVHRAHQALEDRNEAIRDALIEEGERRNWCEELDEFLEANGFEPRTRDYDVEVSFTFTLSTTVTARNADDAQEQVDNEINTRVRVDPFGTGGDYVDLDYTIEGAETA